MASSQRGYDEIENDLAFWMTNLPTKLRSIPIIYLAIPGSHDSTTYGINGKSKVAPDAEPVVQRLKFLGPLLTGIMSRWSRTQLIPVTDQMNNGVRYFDLRIATKQGTEDLYFVHGLYSVRVEGVFDEFRSFLEAHPDEILILDCQHFYEFQQKDHDKLMNTMTSHFGHRLLPYMPHMKHITLDYMTSRFSYQVIIVYRSDAAKFRQPLLWPSLCFPTPWPDTVSIDRLIERLDAGLKSRNPNFAHVTQCILTPTTWFVFKHIFSTLKRKCVVPLEKRKYLWLSQQTPGRGGLNIVISDFVDYEDCQFSRQIIGLNRKLLRIASADFLTPVD